MQIHDDRTEGTSGIILNGTPPSPPLQDQFPAGKMWRRFLLHEVFFPLPSLGIKIPLLYTLYDGLRQRRLLGETFFFLDFRPPRPRAVLPDTDRCPPSFFGGRRRPPFFLCCSARCFSLRQRPHSLPFLPSVKNLSHPAGSLVRRRPTEGASSDRGLVSSVSFLYARWRLTELCFPLLRRPRRAPLEEVGSSPPFSLSRARRLFFHGPCPSMPASVFSKQGRPPPSPSPQAGARPPERTSFLLPRRRLSLFGC